MNVHLRLAGWAALFVAGAPALGAPVYPAGLESFLSYTFNGELTAPEAGNAIAWVELHKGVRNVWAARAPDYRPVRLTNSTADDGQELNELAWSPDGRILVWVRGAVEHNGWANGMPAANPTSAVAEPTMEIWASVDGAPPRLVAEGEEPAVSSRGRIAYLKNGQVWVVDATGTGKPARLFYDRGKAGGLAWSPDGASLAFVSRRGDHSFVGCYTSPDRPIAWLAPATGFDDFPVWSPDGKQIAFIRRPGVSDALATPLVEKSEPFSIWAADVGESTAQRVWQSPDTLEGSFPAVPDGPFLMWADGGRLIFRAEMDGWPHLYSLPASGGAPVLLTPGAYMVEHVTMTPDRKALLFSANSGSSPADIDRRHVFRVGVDRPGATALTSGTGLEWTPAALADGLAAYVSATPQQPPRVVLGQSGGKAARALSPLSTDFPSAQFVIPKPVTFKAADGQVIHGQLFATTRNRQRKPAMIFVHGGPPRQMMLGWSYMDYYTHAYAMNQYLASHGYVVLSVNYRLGIGYGRAFQHPEKAGARGNSEYQDIVAGAHFLQSQPEVDPDRIGIWGGSYGGLLTAQALARDSSLFKAGVDLHGVHDWTLVPGRAVPTRFEDGDYAEATKIAFASSPESAMSGWRSPVLLIHGDDDRNVRFDQTVDLARRLAAQGTPFEELILPNEIHGFLRYDSWLRADTATVTFLDAKLKARQPNTRSSVE